MNSKNSKKKTFNKKSIIVLIIIFFSFILLNSQTNKLYKKSKTIFPTYKTYLESFTVKGMSIFNEKVYKANGNGIALYNASEGEKVPANFEIASINLMNDTSNLKDELSKINAALNYKLNKEQKEIQVDGNFNINKIQDDIKEDNLIRAIADINELDLNTQKDVSVSNLTELMSKSVDELKEKKDELSSQIAKSNVPYVAENSGVVSYIIDGLEEYYKVDKFDKIDNEYILNHSKISEFKSENRVEDGEYLFKLIDNTHYYVALSVNDMTKLNDTKIGDNLELKCDNIYLSGRIVDINRSKKQGVIIIYIDTNFDELYQDRLHEYEIIIDREKCFEIPKSSIVKRDNIFGIYVQEIQGLVRFVPVNVVKLTDENAYVSTGDKNGNILISEKTYKTITINDSIVIYPDKISESQMLN